MAKLQKEKKGGPSGPTQAGGSVGSNGEVKKRRRRRRTRKPSNGGPPRQGNQSRYSSSQGMTSAASGRRPDAPMEKRDLYFVLRCGMVATRGPSGQDTAVGRVTIVNWDKQIVVDTFVKVPPEIVIDYRTEMTGVTKELLAMTSAISYNTARNKVGSLIRGKILIGHCLELDLAALGLSHPFSDVRDTATYAPFMKQSMNGQAVCLLPRRLDELMVHALGRNLDPDQPTLVREAIGCLHLYKAARSQWEYELAHIMQQKANQRQMMLNMRNIAEPQLSSINENTVIATGVTGNLSDSGHHLTYSADSAFDDYDEDEDYTYTSSTLGSTGIATSNVDDDTSSFYTHGTDASGSFFRLQNALPQSQQGNASHIENLSDMGDLASLFPTSGNAAQSAGSNTAPGSLVQSGIVDQWSAHGPAPGTGDSTLWAQSDQSCVISGVTDWSTSSPPKVPSSLGITQDFHNEEEARGHLPSQLLDEVESDATTTHHSMDEIIQKTADVSLSSHASSPATVQKKRGWFGRIRAGSLSSGAEKSDTQDSEAQSLSNSNRSQRGGGPLLKDQEFLNQDVAAPPGFFRRGSRT